MHEADITSVCKNLTFSKLSLFFFASYFYLIHDPKNDIFDGRYFIILFSLEPKHGISQPSNVLGDTFRVSIDK